MIRKGKSVASRLLKARIPLKVDVSEAGEGRSDSRIVAECLDRRIPDKPTIADEVTAWVDKRNAHHAAADWRFTTGGRSPQTEKPLPFTLNKSSR